MVLILVEFQLPEAARDRVLALARTLDAESKREEGCVFYRHALDVSRPDLLVLSEAWRDIDALRAHFRTAHFQAFRALSRELGVHTRIRQFRADELARDARDHVRALLAELDDE